MYKLCCKLAERYIVDADGILLAYTLKELCRLMEEKGKAEFDFYIRGNTLIKKKGSYLQLKEDIANCIERVTANKEYGFRYIHNVNEEFDSISKGIDLKDKHIIGVLQRYEEARVLNVEENTLISIRGAYSLNQISTSMKCYLLAYYYTKVKPEFVCINIVECGRPYLQLLLEYIKNKPILLTNSIYSLGTIRGIEVIY